MSHILIVEDENVIRSALKRLLERNGYNVAEVGSVQEAIERHRFADFDLVITDLRLPGQPGTDLIKLADGVPVLVMTSYASLKSAVDSIKMGAVDYISKPFDHDEMLLCVQRILNERAQKRKIEALEKDLQKIYPAAGMVGKCMPMQELFAKITKVAPTEATVLIRGESGTGKELVARALHEQSHRKSGPMISVNCAAIPDSLIESELFGHEKGAFTGAANMRKGLVEAADGGTLFLDEIGELPLEAQARLLRLMQEKEVRRVGSTQSRRINVRLVAATHRDLKQLSKEGLFREDLYYRLHVLELRLPPLRERGEDVVELASFLLQRSGERIGRPQVRFTIEALDAIRSYSWPGNVRELENSVERAVILSDGETVGAELLSLDVDAKPFGSPVDAEQFRPPQRDFNVPDPTEELSLEDYFQRFVLEHQEHMTETELAQKLGISRKCLWERRQRLGIPRKKPAPRPNLAD